MLHPTTPPPIITSSGGVAASEANAAWRSLMENDINYEDGIFYGLPASEIDPREYKFALLQSMNDPTSLGPLLSRLHFEPDATQRNAGGYAASPACEFLLASPPFESVSRIEPRS